MALSTRKPVRKQRFIAEATQLLATQTDLEVTALDLVNRPRLAYLGSHGE
jgi:hypothetical protein